MEKRMENQEGLQDQLIQNDVVAFAGGLPIKTNNGDFIGAIGVSGATADQDQQCASAAIKAIEKVLK